MGEDGILGQNPIVKLVAAAGTLLAGAAALVKACTPEDKPPQTSVPQPQIVVLPAPELTHQAPDVPAPEPHPAASNGPSEREPKSGTASAAVLSPPPADTTRYLQLATLSMEERAEELASRQSQDLHRVVCVYASENLFVTALGPVTASEAGNLASEVEGSKTVSGGTLVVPGRTYMRRRCFQRRLRQRPFQYPTPPPLSGTARLALRACASSFLPTTSIVRGCAILQAQSGTRSGRKAHGSGRDRANAVAERAEPAQLANMGCCEICSDNGARFAACMAGGNVCD
jgi:hypothetical protein